MILQRSSEHLRDQRSLEDVGKFFEIKGLQGSSKDLCQQRSFEDIRKSFEFKNRPKDLRKIFEMKAHSRIFARSSESKIIQGSSEVLRYRRALKDLWNIILGFFVSVNHKTQDGTSEEQFCCPSD